TRRPRPPSSAAPAMLLGTPSDSLRLFRRALREVLRAVQVREATPRALTLPLFELLSGLLGVAQFHPGSLDRQYRTTLGSGRGGQLDHAVDLRCERRRTGVAPDRLHPHLVDADLAVHDQHGDPHGLLPGSAENALLAFGFLHQPGLRRADGVRR